MLIIAMKVIGYALLEYGSSAPSLHAYGTMPSFFARDNCVILITDLRKNDLIEHPKGGFSYREIPDMPQHGIPTGNIYLRKGEHFANGSGFGVEHIWSAHEYDLRRRGYLIPEDVAAYVAHIVQVGTPIFYDLTPKKVRRRMRVLRSNTDC